MISTIRTNTARILNVFAFPFKTMGRLAVLTSHKISHFVKSHNPFASRSEIDSSDDKSIHIHFPKKQVIIREEQFSSLLERFTLEECESIKKVLRNKSKLADIEETFLQEIEAQISKQIVVDKTWQFPLRPDIVDEEPTLPIKPTKPPKKCSGKELENYQASLKDYKRKKLNFHIEKLNYQAKVKDIEELYAGCASEEEKRLQYEQTYQEFCSTFEEGDLVFFKLDPSKFSVKSAFSHEDYIDYAILRGQKLAKKWAAGSPDKEAYTFIHVGVLIKNKEGKLCFAEATTSDQGDEVRIIDFEELALHSGSKQEYRIERIEDERNRLEMTKMVQHIADEVHYDDDGKPFIPHNEDVAYTSTKGRYTMAGAVGSLFFSAKLDHAAKVDLLIAHAKRIRSPDSLFEERKFYCSYFVGFCLQNGEAHHLFEEEILDEVDKATLEKLDPDDKKGFKKWAKDTAKKHSDIIEEKLSYQFDARSLSPQRLRAYIHANPDQFSCVGRVVGGAAEA